MRKIKNVWAFFALALAFAMTLPSASAAIAIDAIEDLTTDVPAVITAGAALLAIVLVGTLGFKIVRSIAGKST